MSQRTFAEKRFFQWEEDEVAVSLRHSSAPYGGGSEVLVVCNMCGEWSGRHRITHNGGAGTDTKHDARPTDSGDV